MSAFTNTLSLKQAAYFSGVTSVDELTQLVEKRNVSLKMAKFRTVMSSMSKTLDILCASSPEYIGLIWGAVRLVVEANQV